MQLTNKPKQSENATHQIVEQEAVIINLNTGSYYSTNETGTAFWELLNGERSIADCAQVMAAEYDVEASIIEEDLLELATNLEKEGLIIV